MALDLGLTKKRAIITGGSAGIGLACARALFSQGVQVTLAGRSSERLQAAKKDILKGAGSERESEVFPFSCDLANESDVTRLIEASLENFGGIDILINNAGSASAGAFLEMGDVKFKEAWELKFLGYIRMIRGVLPSMIAKNDGRIVNIVGGAARTPRPTFLPGSTTNAALLNFTKGISKQIAQNNIRINTISPGTTATERALSLVDQEAKVRNVENHVVMKERLAAIPLGRMVEPSEVAAMTLLLVSDLIPSMTGAEVIIDGGQTPGV